MRFGFCKYVILYRVGLLVVLVQLGIAMGVWQEILVPTLPNLKEKLNVTYEVMGKVMSSRTMGNIVTLILAAYLFDSFPNLMNYIIFLACFLAGVSTIIIPWCTQLWLVVLLFFIQCGSQELITNGAQVTIMRTFRERAVSRIQIYHLGYGIGGLLSGLIAQPFLPRKSFQKGKITEYCKRQLGTNGSIVLQSVIGTSPQNMSNTTGNASKMEISFEYIYLVAGLIAIGVSLVFFCFIHLRNPDKVAIQFRGKESWLAKIHPNYTAKGKVAYGTCMTVLLFLFYFFYIFGVISFVPMMVVYAIDPCKEYFLSQKEAAYMNSVINGCFLLGRVAGVLSMSWNPTVTLLFFNFMNIVFVSILVLFSNQYSAALWIGACGMRFCNSINFPGGTSYVNRHIIVTSTLVSIAFMGATFGSILSQILSGYIVDNYPSFYIFIPCLVSMSALFIVTVAIIVLGRRYGLRDFTETGVISKPNEKDNENL